MPWLSTTVLPQELWWNSQLDAYIALLCLLFIQRKDPSAETDRRETHLGQWRRRLIIIGNYDLLGFIAEKENERVKSGIE